MAGMRVVVVAALGDGTVDLEDLRAKCEEHGDRLAAIMVTYPSTHGVYEEGISDMCALVHQHGGQVYIDGANLNALLGLAEPGQFGGDVSHLNLHKTFCIPHGGGGPGVGPVAVAEHLVPFLPSHPLHPRPAQREGIGPVSAAPFGSAGILAISWAYIRMLSGAGLAHATKSAVLAANYVAARLAPSFPILYTGKHDLVAHECILDLRPLTKATGVTVDDVAKRLIDYGFHAPTVSFPVAGTLMVEPTESEDLAELDRFCDAMIAIRAEIDEVAAGRWAVEDSPLRGAPHTAAALVSDWDRPYDRATAVFPSGRTAAKYWPPVARINQAYGDRNLDVHVPAAGGLRRLTAPVARARPWPHAGHGSSDWRVASHTRRNCLASSDGAPWHRGHARRGSHPCRRPDRDRAGQHAEVLWWAPRWSWRSPSEPCSSGAASRGLVAPHRRPDGCPGSEKRHERTSGRPTADLQTLGTVLAGLGSQQRAAESELDTFSRDMTDGTLQRFTAGAPGAASADEVSAAIAQLFSAHARQYAALAAQAEAIHEEFVNTMTAAAGSYDGGGGYASAMRPMPAAAAPRQTASPPTV